MTSARTGDSAPTQRSRYDFEGLRVRHFDLPARFSVPFHHHDQPTLVVQLRGGYTGRGVWKDCEVRAGDVLTLPAETRHAEDVASVRSSVLLVEATGSRKIALDLFQRQIKYAGAAARAFAWRIQKELTVGDDVAAMALEGLLLELLAELARDERPPDSTRASWIADVRELLESRLQSPMTLAELAGAVGVSRSYLARTFKEVYGCSVGEFVRKRRVERAVELLQASDRLLVDIALDCGFYDQSHLCRSLRNRLGVTPSELRRCS